MYTHILVALDGSDLAERVLVYVQPLVEKFGSKVTLIRATTSTETFIAATAGDQVAGAWPAVDPVELAEEEQEDTASYLQGLAQRLGQQGLTVDFEEPQGDAADTVVRRAAALGADLIAMTTHGRTGLGRLLLGSVAEGVIRHAPCPVLLVRVNEDEHHAS
jgi:nucleotide-binding universal stress UspA family protein